MKYYNYYNYNLNTFKGKYEKANNKFTKTNKNEKATLLF